MAFKPLKFLAETQGKIDAFERKAFNKVLGIEGPQEERARLATENREQNVSLLGALGGDALAFPDIAQQAQGLIDLPTNEAVAGLEGLLQQGQSQTAPAKLAREQVAQQNQLAGEIQQGQRDAQIVAAQRVADADAATQLNTQQFGGLTAGEHGKRVVELGNLNFGLGVVEDLTTLNRELGREVIPSGAKGAYEALRGQALNTLRVQFEAGALQAAELEFFESLLPEFGAFASLSSEQREAKLRELGRAVGNRRDTLAGITAGQQGMVGQPGTARTLTEILGDPKLPDGAIRVESSFLEKLAESPVTRLVTDPVSGLLGNIETGVEGLQGIIRQGAEESGRR